MLIQVLLLRFMFFFFSSNTVFPKMVCQFNPYYDDVCSRVTFSDHFGFNSLFVLVICVGVPYYSFIFLVSDVGSQVMVTGRAD